MAQINKSNEYFNSVLYAGNSGTQSITGVNFQPDFLWIKRRTLAGDHNLVDVIRTSDKTLISNATSAEYSNATITSFDSDGFSLSGTDGALNASGSNYVAWNWLASNTTASNTDGSITSTVSANTTSGFSIVSYTGTGASATVGHGLGSSPKMVIVKKRDGASTWLTYNANIGNGYDYYLALNSTAIANSADATVWNNTNPTSTVFSLGNWGDLNGNGSTYIAYCFAEKKGFSKFGSYTGNGIDSNGTFVYTGFKPAFIITKNTISTTANWLMQTADGLNTYNPVKYGQLRPNLDNAEVTAYTTDFLSNGFKFYNDTDQANSSGQTFIYMAFAENPLVGTNNIPTTAR
jgi:hypothetical protein